jgi:glycosyltransferase involved in cell wall biosynthesis
MPRKRIIWIGDWMLNRDGTPLTGYAGISDIYAKELHKEYNIIALGFAYQRTPHKYLFSLTHTPIPALGTAIQSINSTYPIDYIICSADITLQRQLIKIHRGNTKYIGIFAVESSPLYAPWAMDLAQMDYRFPISEFGKQECEKAGIESTHLVIPTDRNIWRPRTPDEKNSIKDMLGVKDKTTLFINAAGNERKNISTVLEALKDIPNKEKYYLFMLTNSDTQVSWDLRELVTRFDLNRNVTIFEKGLSTEETRRLYAGADFFINISKAEGLCMPILEAMSVGVPVIATNCTAMKEHLKGGERGIAIEPDFKLIDVFGNTDRFYVVAKTFQDTLSENRQALLSNPELFDNITKKAQEYIDERNSKSSINDLRKVINE